MRAGCADTTLHTCYEAIPASVGIARTDIVAFALAAGASKQQTERLKLAVSEAMSNAVVHAYAKDPCGVIRLTATEIAGDLLLVVVADDGCGLGHASKSVGLGLGLEVITQLADRVTLRRRSSGGTQVEMRFELADVCEDAEAPADGRGIARELAQERGLLSSATWPA